MSFNTFSPFNWYTSLYQYVAFYRLRKNDLDPKRIHAHLAITLSTSVLMWAHTILACITINSPIPCIVGFVASTIHLLSPLMFRYTNREYLVANIMLGAGIIHQSTFSYFSGGFLSNVIIWFGILPMLAGMICGRRGATTWFLISLFTISCFMILFLLGHEFPKAISNIGNIWAHALIAFGWICLSSVIIIVFVGIREASEKRLEDQGHRIDDLFRVLFHDLANPLGRVSIGLSIAKKQMKPDEANQGLDIAIQASDSMLEITKNVRKMYAVSKGKENVDLTFCPLNTAIEYVKNLYATDLERKHIELQYHFEKNSGLNLFVESVSFNNQVLGNIISNAIKFSQPGSKIILNVYPVTHETYALEIKDMGIGIPPKLLSQLFDLNRKIHRPGTQGESGSGLGMHIVKTFVEMYGGKINIESQEAAEDTPGGTTIRLILKGEWN